MPGDDTVTRDALRADLAELKVDLLEKLAPISRLEALERQYRDLLTQQMSHEAVKQILADSLRDAEARGWSGRERLMGIALFLLTIASFFLNVYALH